VLFARGLPASVVENAGGTYNRCMSAVGLPGFIGRWFWLLAIVTNGINAGLWWRRAQPRIAQRPELAAGYLRLIRGWLFFGSLYWLVMGVGIVVGGVPDTFAFFHPRNGPYEMAAYLTLVVLWVLAFVWLFFRGGVEQLVAHPEILNLTSPTPRSVKQFLILMMAGSLVPLALMLADVFPR
jgi:hypothetical protein